MMDLPLKNKQIVITRDQHQAKGLLRRLAELGAHPMAFPTLKIVAPSDWGPCDSAIARIHDFDWIVFSSVNGVRHFVSRCQLKGMDMSETKARIAAVGAKTREELLHFDIEVDLTPGSYSAQGLLDAFTPTEMRGKKILLPSSEISRDELETGLDNMGAKVSRVIVYRNVANLENDPEILIKKIEEGKIDCLVFFSPSSVHYLAEIIGEAAIASIRESSIAIAAIGPTTAQTLRQIGIMPDILPAIGTEEGLVSAIIKYFKVPIE